ncbi:MAG TPA: hypothetical protein VGF19_07995 [Candidatus Acidoferrum sp.]
MRLRHSYGMTARSAGNRLRCVAAVCSLFVVCESCPTGHVWAQSTPEPQLTDQKKIGREPSPGMYVSPDEQHPAVAIPIWRQSNHQTYVSVGTERSFIGAAMTLASALVVIDYDPKIVQFAAINRALLAASHNREDYLTLRLLAPVAVWAERGREVSAEDAQTLRDEESWKFWKEKVRQNTGSWSSAFGNLNKPADAPDAPFARTNYLFDDQLFRHLRDLAKSGRIWTRTLDLRDKAAVHTLCEDLQAKGLKLGIVDTSNVPDESEAGAATAGQYITWFAKYAGDGALFLNTERANRHSDTYWSYYAFTYRAVKTKDAKTITRWYQKEIAKLQSDSQTRAVIDDPDVVGN